MPPTLKSESNVNMTRKELLSLLIIHHDRVPGKITVPTTAMSVFGMHPQRLAEEG